MEDNKKIYKQLLACQKEIGAITKTQDNPFFHSKYADINAILSVVKPILNSHGLILIQPLSMVNDLPALYTAIIDEDGNKIDFITPLPVMSDPQKQGSAITYFRRYAIQSILALETQDDDGNVASQGDKVTKAVKKNEEEFFHSMQPTDEEVILGQEILESSQTLAELKANWKKLTPMVQDKLNKVKDNLKFKLV